MENFGKKIGEGAFGRVYEYVLKSGEKCAIKILSKDFDSPAFIKECQIMCSLSHPNIVRCFDFSHIDGFLALRMELLKENLHSMLKDLHQPLDFCTQVDICYDIAAGLHYLHSNNIVHRDLSDNNVLMTLNTRAKISDFGLAKIVTTINPSWTPNVRGAPLFMPPEVLSHPSKKIDCYSLGVLSLLIFTSNQYRSEMVQNQQQNQQQVVPPLWIIDCISCPLVKRAVAKCLNASYSSRPSAQECFDFFSLVQSKNKCEEQVARKAEQLHRAEQETERLGGIIQVKETCLQRITNDLHAEKRERLQVNEKLEKMTYQVMILHENVQKLIEDKQKLTDKLQKKDKYLQKFVVRSEKCPLCMLRGQSTQKDGMIYIRTHDMLYSYDINDGKWNKLPSLKQRDCSLEMFDNYLIAIGGRIKATDKPTNLIYTLYINGGNDEWQESTDYPPMPTERATPVSVSTNDHLIVMGGGSGKTYESNFDIVEVFTRHVQQWSKVANMLYPIGWQSAVLCNDQIFILGGNDGKDKTKNVLTCKLSELIASQPEDKIRIWKQAARLPHFYATCGVFNGQVIAVGGCSSSSECESVVLEYDMQDDDWNPIGYLKQPRARPYVATLGNKIIVIGGYCMKSNKPEELNTVEEGIY